MNANNVDVNNEPSGSNTDLPDGMLSNSPTHNDCSKFCNNAVGGARPKVRHVMCNLPSDIVNTSDDHIDDVGAKVNNNVVPNKTCGETNVSDHSVGISSSKIHNGLNHNHENSSEAIVENDSYLRNNVNFHTTGDKCPVKVQSCSVSDNNKHVFSLNSSDYHIVGNRNISDIRWGENDSSSDTGNEGEDGLSADECCIYTYKGDQMADLPSSFFRLDMLSGGDQNASGGRSRGRSGDKSDQNSGSCSPEMDFLEMDFDPGPSCEQDSDEDSDHGELKDEEALAFPSTSENHLSDPLRNLECRVEQQEVRMNMNAEAGSSDNEVHSSISGPGTSPTSIEEPQGCAEIDSVNVQSSHVSQNSDIANVLPHRVFITCCPARDAWGYHCNSGDLCSPGDSADVEGEQWNDNLPLFNVGNLKIQEGLLESRRYNLHSTLYHCVMAKRLVLDKQTLSSGDEINEEGKLDNCPDGLKSVERVMIWTEQEAREKQVTQISTSACGATAVINVLLALNIPFSLDKVKEGVATRLRSENSSLPEYLFSRSVAGATHGDIIRGVEHASEGRLYARFFHMYPARDISLTSWLAYWMKKGAVPIATLNLQNGVASGSPIPDAWHHQMVFGVGPQGVYLTNPLERVNEGALWPQLCSPSVLLVRRNDVLSRWNDHTDLSPLMLHSDHRWKTMNVLGQVVNIIRESQNSRANNQGRITTQHIAIPAMYCSGIALVISRESPDYEELRTSSDFPLLHFQ